MLLKIFAGIGACGSVLQTALSGGSGSAAKTALMLCLRFLEYFFGAHVAYALLMYIGTELFIDLKKPQEKPSKFWIWHLRQVADLLCFWARVDIISTGEELIPHDTRYLLVSNHRSVADPVVTIKRFPHEDLAFVSKPGNFRIPIVGKVMHKCGCLSLDRDDNRAALKTIKHAEEYIEKDYTSIAIYPEGTRCHDDKMLPFHAGSFKIAQKAKVPVVCCCLRNTDKVAHNFPLKRTKIYIDILGVIDTEYVTSHKTRETAALAEEMIQAKLDKEREIGSET